MDKDKTQNLLNIVANNNYEDIVNFIDKEDNFMNILVNGNNILNLLAIANSDNLPKLVNKYNNYFKFGDKLDGNTPVHLLTKYGKYDLLKKCIKEDPSLGTLINSYGENILLIGYDKADFFLWLLDNAEYDINRTTTYGVNILTKVIMESNNKLLKKIVKIKDINLDIPKNSVPLSGTILSKNDAGAQILLENNANPNTIDNANKTPLIYSALTKNKNICEMLIKYGVDLNYVGIDRTFNPLNIALVKNEPEICKLLLDSGINVNTTDKFIETPVHTALKLAKFNKISDQLLNRIIKRGDLNIQNINGVTPFHLITRNKLFDRVSKSLKDKKIITNLKDKHGKSALDYANKNVVNTFKNIQNRSMPSTNNQLQSDSEQNITNELQIKLSFPKKQEYNYGLFNPDLISNIVFIIGMLEKYEQIGIPYQYPIEEIRLTQLKLLNLNRNFIDRSNAIVYELVNIYLEFFFSFVPYCIIWKSKTEHYFPKNLKTHCISILKNESMRFIILKLTLIPNNSGTHANVIIYDKKTKTAERFEPFGYNSLLDADILDSKIKRYLEKAFGKISYIGPKDYLGKIKFQIISDDANPNNKKIGDPLGYCLAWTYWYCELRIANPDVEPNDLINTAFEKIIKEYEYSPNFMLSFIRNYAKSLDELKNKTLLKIGITKDHLYDTYANIDDGKKLIKKINEYYTQNFINKY